MNIEKARQYAVHRFNGELSARKCRALERFVARRPEFAAEVNRMEQTWRKLDLLKGEALAAPEMGRALRQQLDLTAAAPGHGPGRALRWAFAGAVVILIGLVAFYWQFFFLILTYPSYLNGHWFFYLA